MAGSYAILDLQTPSGPEGSSGSKFHMCRRVPSHFLLIDSTYCISKNRIMTKQAYQVIARRWRPKQFDELVGQDHIVKTLTNAIESNRIAHAYLFVGPRGTGKTSTARLFAKALNAEGGPSVTVNNESEVSQHHEWLLHGCD